MTDLPERTAEPGEGPLPPLPESVYGPEAKALANIIESGQIAGLDVEANGGYVIEDDEADRSQQKKAEMTTDINPVAPLSVSHRRGIRYFHIGSWAWPGSSYPRFGAWRNAWGVTLRYRAHQLHIYWRR